MSNTNTNITGQSAGFAVDSNGLYAIKISVNCYHPQDLRVEIDGRSFRELPPLDNIQQFDVSAAYNGAKLKGKTQTNIFLLNLTKGKHTLNFVARNGAEVTNWEQQKIIDSSKAVFDLNLQAQDYERQPFVNFILVDLPLSSITAEVTLDWHPKFLRRGDGDDVKLIVDNVAQTDNQTNWLWRATKQQQDTGAITLKKSVATNLTTGIHYLEFMADRSPVLKQVSLNLDQGGHPTGSYVGDFKCKAEERKIDNEIKKVLGIYKNGRDGKVFVQSNENYRLFFNGIEQPVGEDLKGLESIAKVRFDLFNLRDSQNDWFYFGMDSTFVNLLHPFSWNKNELWTVYEK